MAQLTLAQLISFVGTYVGDTSQLKVVTVANLVIEDIHEKVVQKEDSTFTTKAPVTTGTVSVTNGSTTATFSSGVVLVADPLRRVRIAGQGAWYGLTRGVGDVNGVLSSAYDGDTDALATYEIVYPAVTFANEVGQVHRIWREGMRDLISAADVNEPARAAASGSGTPLWHAPYVFDATTAGEDKLRKLLIPAPDNDYTFSFTFSRRPSRIATDAATSVVVNLPSMCDRALCYGVVRDLWSAVDKDSRAAPWGRRYDYAIAQALAHTSKGSQTQRRSPYEARETQEACWQGPPVL